MEQADSEKFIGVINWFYDQAMNANYGFIQHHILGELFFHKKSIERGQDIDSFKENEIVVFHSQPSRNPKHLEELEAVQVKNLNTEEDLNFLFGHLLSFLTEKEKYSDYNFIQNGVQSRIAYLLDITVENKTKEELFDQYKSFLIEQFKSDIQFTEIFVKEFLNICGSFFPDNYKEISNLIEKEINVETAHELWLESYIEKCQVNYIAKTFLNADIQTKKKIIGRCTGEDKLNIFFNIIYTLERIDTDLKFESIKELINLSKEFNNEQHDNILDAALKICPEYFKLDLWLQDYHEKLDFNSFKLFTITLIPVEQKKFVKKILKYIHEGKTKLSIEEFTSINLIDFEISKAVKKLDNSHLDYSTSIILNVIAELHNQTKIETKKETIQAQQRMYELIIKQIKQPDDILEITGFFDECEGRCSVTIDPIKNENDERIINYSPNKFKKPKLHPICDGRKAINIKTQTNSLCEKYGIEFWSCAGQKCYKPSRQLHIAENWQEYSLLDFLTILKVKFSEKDFEMYLNLINKANHFLKHLKCRKCNQILRPIKQSNYAFHGVNDFHCTNESCDEKGKIIYLTHCLNGRCEQTIDSRDSIKCKPEGFESEKCGWYVCNYCHACCSDESISRRINILGWTGQEYKCHTKGHRNMGVISCNKCGSGMNSNDQIETEYRKILNWFINNKQNQIFIEKFGQQDNGKWWFRFKKHNLSHNEYYQKLTNLLKLGFNIPNYEEYERTIQLVSEAFKEEKSNSEILICSNTECKNILNVRSDMERFSAIKYFHNIRFVEHK